MKSEWYSKAALSFIFALLFFVTLAGQSFAQGKSDKAKEKQANKVDKDANKLAKTAEQARKGIGRDAVFCVLAAHTTDVGTAQQLKDKYNSLENFPFGQFVAAVIMADRLDKPLDEILLKLQDGKSLGQIAKEFDVDMGELRQGFGEFRSELARSMTNPPTRDCFSTTGS
jgi:hypothetical protein